MNYPETRDAGPVLEHRAGEVLTPRGLTTTPTSVQLAADESHAPSAEYVRGYVDGLDAAEAGRRPQDWLAGWEARARLEREAVQREWAAVRDVVARTAASLTYAELAERRGEPHRAERQREILRQNGLAA